MSLGGVPPLIALLGHGSDEAKVHAARALENLALNDKNKVKIVKMGGVPPLVKMSNGGAGEVKNSARAALKLLNSGNGKIKMRVKKDSTPAAKSGSSPMMRKAKRPRPIDESDDE